MKLLKQIALLLALPALMTVPALATTVSNVQKGGTWKAAHDAGTTGTSSGWMELTGSPSKTGSARHMSTSYKNYGGERYERSIPDDVSAHNFVYDAWVYIKGSALGAKSIEMDLNHVMSNGWTVIMGFQCDGWSGTWDYTANEGTATKPKDKWIHSAVACRTSNWKLNAWHHVQIHYFHDSSGYVTYQSVVFDGVSHSINKKVFAGFALGWGKTILTNFQIDGGTSYSYSSNVFLDNLAISYW